MRLFFYYVTRTVKNQIRKLFKTWVAVFLIVCFGIGFLMGGLGSLLDEAFPEEDVPGDVEEIPDEEFEEIPEEVYLTEEEVQAVIELVAGAVVLLLLALSVLGADKSGNAIFLPADVPTLFASPLRPQAVLLFRLLMQSGTFIFLGFYMALQLPTLLEVGIPILLLLGVAATWILLMLVSKILQTLLYTLASTHPRLKRLLRPVTLGVLVAGALVTALLINTSEKAPLTAARDVFNAPLTRYLPIWGWIKGLFMFSLEGNLLGVLITLLATVATSVLLAFILWRARADFYEEAMQKSEEMRAVLDAAAQSSSGVTVMRTGKKDRSDRLRRDGLSRGEGATVYFHKTLYNRFRFAHLRIFTKTSETYLAVALIVCAILRFAVEWCNILPVGLVLSGLVFFRSLGNPLSQDISMDSFLLVPENTWKKVFFSLAGGTVNSLLDLIPALLAATVFLGANPLEALAWLLFALSVELYSTTAGMFVDLSIPVSLGKQIKTMIQVMFVYFGLLPDIVILLIGGLLGILPIAAVAAVFLNLALAGAFYGLSPLFLERGRR